MKKLLAFFFVLIAITLLAQISKAQLNYQFAPNNDFFLNTYSLLDSNPDVINLSGYQFDRDILFPLKTQNCDPGILFSLSKRDLDFDPGILVPFHYMDGMGQHEFLYPMLPYFEFPLEPNLLPDLRFAPHYWLNPHELNMRESDWENWDMLTPNEKFGLGIHRSYPK
jgi:hypothetical protein